MNNTDESLIIRFIGFGKAYAIVNHKGDDELKTRSKGKDSRKTKLISKKIRGNQNLKNSADAVLANECEIAFNEDYTEMFETALISTDV